MKIFISCLVDHKFELLVLEGPYNEDEVLETWSKIISEYSSAINPTETKLKIDSLLNVANIEGRLTLIADTLELFQTGSEIIRKHLFPLLYQFGYPIPAKEYSIENLEYVLKIFIGHYKLEMHKHALIKKDFTEETNGKDEYSWESFQDILTTISITMKMPPIDLNSITTGQFCSFIIQFNKYVKHNTKS